MAKEKSTQTRTSIDELNENLSSIEQKVENNKKIIIYAATAIVIIAAIIFGYKYLYQQPSLPSRYVACSRSGLCGSCSIQSRCR